MKLSDPITLRDGRKLSTLQEAVALMDTLPERRQLLPVWQKTCQMLLQAKKTRRGVDMQHATLQLCRALQVEGWVS